MARVSTIENLVNTLETDADVRFYQLTVRVDALELDKKFLQEHVNTLKSANNSQSAEIHTLKKT